MKLDRLEFLAILKTVICGAHQKEILEQSHCFIFQEKSITSFNGEILSQAKFSNSLGKFAVPAYDLIQLVTKFPDKEITLTIKSQQLVILGKKKRAGLTIHSEILLPIEDIKVPKKMEKIKEGIMEALIMAAKICSPGHEDYRVSHVHISSNKIQSTDKYRFLRTSIVTGLKTILVPSNALLTIADIKINKIKMTKGWLWFGNKDIRLGICCSEEEYYEDKMIDNVITMNNGKPVQLPKEMINVVDRALIMAKDDVTRMSKIILTSRFITVRTQKESGWYEERQSVKYKGKDMKLFVGLSLFKDLLNKTHKVYISQDKIKMKKNNIEFLICLGE